MGGKFRISYGIVKAGTLATVVVTAVPNPIPKVEEEKGSDATENDKPEPELKLSLPTIKECKVQLNISPNTTLFYSGGPEFYLKASEAINTREYLKGYQIMAQKWKDPDWLLAWQVEPELCKQFWDICSKALAQSTSGTAYVLLPKGKGTNWVKGTVWDRKEWPNIPKHVTVIRIDPDDPDDMEIIPRGSSVARKMHGMIKFRSWTSLKLVIKRPQLADAGGCAEIGTVSQVSIQDYAQKI